MGAEIADAYAKKLAGGVAVGDFDCFYRGVVDEGGKGFVIVAFGGVVPLAAVALVEIVFLLGGCGRIDADGEVLIFAPGSSLGFVGGEFFDGDANRNAAAAGGADGLVDDFSAAAEAGIHELVIEIGFDGGGPEGAGGGEAIFEVGTGVVGGGGEAEGDGGRVTGVMAELRLGCGVIH